MKQLLPFAFLILIFCGKHVQAQIDIQAAFIMSSVVQTTPPPPQFHMPAGLSAPVVYTITNIGPDTLPAGLRYKVEIMDNGVKFYDSDTVSIPGEVAPDSILIFHTPQQYVLDEVVPNHTVCIEIILIDSTDNDEDNNDFCIPFQIKFDTYPIDWSVDSIEMYNPTFEDTMDIYNNEYPIPRNPDTVYVYFTNTSAISYTPYHKFSITLYRGGNTFKKQFALDTFMLPGDWDVVKFYNPFEIPDLPKDSGVYEYCAYGKFQQDGDTLNDTTCMTMVIIDTWDPTNPDNWVVGVNESPEQNLSVYYYKGEIIVSNPGKPLGLRISDITGREVAFVAENGSETRRVPFGNMPPGIYLVQLIDNGNLIGARKIVVP